MYVIVSSKTFAFAEIMPELMVINAWNLTNDYYLIVKPVKLLTHSNIKLRTYDNSILFDCVLLQGLLLYSDQIYIFLTYEENWQTVDSRAYSDTREKVLFNEDKLISKFHTLFSEYFLYKNMAPNANILELRSSK